MKMHTCWLVTLLVLATSLTSLKADEKPMKLRVIKPPTSYAIEVIVNPREVLYFADDQKAGVYASFTADFSGKLKNLRIVINDATFYEWDCVYLPDGSVDMSNHRKDAVHHSNIVTIDREDWLRFFEKKLVMPPFKFQKERKSFAVCKYSFEFVGITDFSGKSGLERRKGLRASFRVEGSPVLVSLDEQEFILPFSRSEKFFLGMKDGKFIPLVKKGDAWYVPILEDIINDGELPTDLE